MKRGVNMPTTYAHYKFGTEVLQVLPEPVQKVIKTHRELYDIGLHGPDILFYYLDDLHRGSVNKMGQSLHKTMGDEFFRHGMQVIQSEWNPSKGRAYMDGFICHFALDSECHPYVEKMIQVSGISHNEIEMEFDRYLMVEDGIDPVTYLATDSIHPTKENAKVIAPFFEGLTPGQIQDALKGMVACHKIFLAPGQVKRNVLYGIMKVAGVYDSLRGKVMSLTPNPVCAEYNLVLKAAYDRAVPIAAGLIMDYLRSLKYGTPLPERFHRTFSAGDDWESLKVRL